MVNCLKFCKKRTNNNNFNRHEIGEKTIIMDLQIKRKEIGLTSAEAARILGISQAYLSLLENGKRKITSKLESRFIEAFNINNTEAKELSQKTNSKVKAYKSWISQIRINKEPLCKAFSRELKYFPLKDCGDESEILYRLIGFIDKNIAHSVRNELAQNANLLSWFTEKVR